MEYITVQQPNSELMIIAVSESFILIEAIRILREILISAYKEGKKYVFCDLTDLKGDPKPMERYDFAQSVSTVYPALVQEYKYGMKIVLCGNEPLISPERFGEIVARNRFLNLKVFTDKEEGMKWLLNKENS